MALKKLPCEYPELQEERWKECFGMFTVEQQLKLMKQINAIYETCNRNDSLRFKAKNVYNQ